jgi:ATP-dependent DNA helicase RecQ
LAAGASDANAKKTVGASSVAQAKVPALLRPKALSDPDLLAVRKLLSGVARGRGQLTAEQLTALLRGDAHGVPPELASTPTFGSLADWTASDLMALAHSLQVAGGLAWEGERPPRAKLTESGIKIMRGDVVPQLVFAPVARAENEATVDPLLFEALREARRREAEKRGIPPFVVAHDAVLAHIAALRPRTLDALVQIKGIGPKKAQEYGAIWLDVVKREPARGFR